MQDEGSEALILRTVRAPSTRIFLIKFLSFQNGCFIIVAEDSNRIGSLYVSIASANKVTQQKLFRVSMTLFLSTHFGKNIYYDKWYLSCLHAQRKEFASR